MLLFIVITNFLFHQQIIATKHLSHSENRLVTDPNNNWNDWVLKNASQTLQGPVTDERFADFQITSLNFFTFKFSTSISFSIYSLHPITFWLISTNNSNNQYTTKTGWTHYTILPSNDGICLFENSLSIATIHDFSMSEVQIKTTHYTNFTFHEYPVRMANHISKEPTILNVSPKIPHLVLYAYLCSHCTLEVYLPGGQKRSLFAPETDVPELWKPVSLFVINGPNITLVRNTTNGRYDGYWSVDLRPRYEILLTAMNSNNQINRSDSCNCGTSRKACQVDCKIAPQVKISHVEVENFSITIYWNIVDNCRIQHFIVDFQKRTYKTRRFSYFLENLNTCTNYTIGVSAGVNDINIGKKTYKTVEIKTGVPKPPKFVAINLDGNNTKLFFKVESGKRYECDTSKLIISCQPNITSKPQLQSEEKTSLYFVDFSTTFRSLSCTSFTTNSAGRSSEYLFTLFKEEIGAYNFGFRPPLELQNQSDFYNISIKVHPLKNYYNETFPATATVTHGLITNSSLSYFKVCYYGERSGFSNLTGCIKTNRTSTDFFLQPLRKYSMNVTVVTKYFTLPIVYLPTFESKPGVPVLNANLNAPTTNRTKANFLLVKSSFSEVNGEIIAYALILSTQLLNTSREYGFWNGTEETWPSLPENSTQLTAKFWNPFKDKNQNYLFVIGSGDNCQEKIDCNPPLEPNKEYYFFVRVFTRAAYKDSSLMHFKTDSETTESKLINLTYATIICFSFLLVILIFNVHLYTKQKPNRRTATSRNEAESTFLLCELEMRRGIEITQFDQFLSDEFANRIKLEFDTFEVTETQPLTVGSDPSNINKNRKQEKYLPYDSNRVILNDLPGIGDGNYINANYINGFNHSKIYISAQGPRLRTIQNFWRMIWQENIELVIMTSNTVENNERVCAEYWPAAKNGIFECGRMIIKLVHQSSYEFYVRREFQVSFNSCKKHIIHFQIKWAADSDICYPNQFLPAIKFLQEHEVSSSVLVHSGYGVGRTGVVILCDMALEMIKNTGKVDFYKLTKNLKEQRLFMVKALEHYASAHFIIKEFFMDKENPFKNSINKNTLQEQLEYVDTLCRHDTVLQKLTSTKQTESKVIVPVLRYEGNGKFMVSQEPSGDDFVSFWTKVADESVERIVFLNKKNPFSSYLCKGDKKVIELSFLETSRTNVCVLKKFSLLIYDAITKQIIYEGNILMYEFNDWKPKKVVPSSIENFVELVNGVNKLASNKLTLVLCKDGCTASGLFVVVSYILDQYKSNLEIDVCTAIRVTRRSGRKFIESEEQLKYVYDCLTEFCKNNESYQTVDCYL